MKFKLKHFFTYSLLSVFIILPFSQNLSAYQAQVKNISNREYFHNVKEAIDNAEKSISAAIYIISLREDQPNSQVYQLCQALVDAHNRGVDVRIVLDQNVDFFRKDEDMSWEVEGKNNTAYNFFKRNGVDVVLDDKFIYMHSKALVIDEEIVIVGSANWSQSALSRNTETSVLIKSPELAKSILRNFDEIKLEEVVQDFRVIEFNEETAVRVPKLFYENENLAGQMITRQDERAFDLYLLLLYNANEENTIDFDFSEYAKALGIDHMSTTAYRRQIIKTLRKLQNRYKLIQVEFHYADNADVKLMNLRDTGVAYQYPEENYFLLPSEYFEDGWDRTLSSTAKYIFLINRFMIKEINRNHWSLSLNNLSEKFHLTPDTITRGMQELRRLNIIDIEYSEREEDMIHRWPSTYKMIGLYSPVEHKEKMQNLADKYGEDKFKNAVEFAKVIFKQNDIDAIEKIINLTEEYGEEKIKKAYEILSKKSVNNSKRTFRYAVGIIKK